MEEIMTMVWEKIIDYGPRVIGAIIVVIVGFRLIKFFRVLLEKRMQKRRVDISLRHFLSALVSIILKVALLISAAGIIGIETTSFIAILGAIGLAIGLALQGSLANFAGGALILFFKPFRVGHFINAQGEMGKVKEINILTTKLLTPENKLVIIPNGVLANGNIVNYTEEGMVRVDIVVGISYGSDIKKTRDVITKVMEAHELVLDDPKPELHVLELGDSSVNLGVRPYSKPENYREVFFDITEEVKLALDKNDIEIPFPQRVVHMVK